MSTVIRGIALNLGVFALDNNVRRSVAAVSTNYTPDNADVNIAYVTLNPGQSFSPNMETNSIVVLHVSAPIRVDATFSAMTAGTYTRPAAGNTFIVSQTMVCDDNITALTLTNNQSYAVRVTLVHG